MVLVCERSVVESYRVMVMNPVPTCTVLIFPVLSRATNVIPCVWRHDFHGVALVEKMLLQKKDLGFSRKEMEYGDVCVDQYFCRPF